MTRSMRGPVLFLLGIGVLLLLIGAAGVFAGLALADRIHALLPPITADARAIGGAALALGAAFLLAGAAHLALAILLRRPPATLGEGVLVSGIAFCSVMGALAAGWSLTAFISAASGSAPVQGMLPAGVGTGIMAAAYAGVAATLLRLRAGTSGPD